jgi:hypothetical protein
MSKRDFSSTAAVSVDEGALPQAPKRHQRDTDHDNIEDERSPGHVFGYDATPDTIADHFRRHGIVVVRFLTDEQRRALIKEQVTEVLLKQPWIRTLQVRDPATGALLDIEGDTDAYIAALTRDNLPAETRKAWRDCWPLHAGFGACCDPGVFHLQRVWEMRQDPRLYAIASALMGRTDLWVDINRSIQLMPGEGEEEFAHWDKAYMHEPPPSDLSEQPGIAGKVMYTDGSFRCVPGSSTPAFHRAFCAQYRPLYPGASANDAKFGLDKSKPDPMGLIGKCVSIDVPKGCVIFWSHFMLHGPKKNPIKGHVQFGAYIGFMRAIDRGIYQSKCGVNERRDRIDSYLRGVAPRLWPSLDEIHYYPKRFINFYKHLKPYVDKTRPDHPGLAERVVKANGTRVVHLVPVPDPSYAPPPLTLLGQRLLGLSHW